MNLDTFMRERTINFFLALNNSYITKANKDIGFTYSHCMKLSEKFKEKGLIYFKKNGRNKHALLTKKGIKLRDELKKLVWRIDYYEFKGKDEEEAGKFRYRQRDKETDPVGQDSNMDFD